MAHITREVAFAQNKPLQGFFARSNGPRQYAHLVIKTGQRNRSQAVRRFLRIGLHAPKFHFIWGAIAAFCGWFGTLMMPAAGMPFLALMFVICYIVDDRTWVRAGLSEWLTARFHATVIAVLSCLAGAAGSM